MSATPHSITEPLNLRGYLKTAPKPGWSFIAVLDILLIAGILFIHQSRFVYGTGAEIELVRSNPGRFAVTAGTAVLTVRAYDLIFFDGQKVSLDRLPASLGAFAREHEGEKALLLKVDHSISLQTLFGLFEMAQGAGFDRVQIASEPPAGKSPYGPEMP